MFTLFTIFSFVSGVAGAGAHDADATVPTLRVNALRSGHVALGALPATEAQAATLGVLPVAAAQHWTGCCKIDHDRAVGRHSQG